jgi:hypothetical protein
MKCANETVTIELKNGVLNALDRISLAADLANYGW